MGQPGTTTRTADLTKILEKVETLRRLHLHAGRIPPVADATLFDANRALAKLIEAYEHDQYRPVRGAGSR